jgi:acyl phosphate:glycerol-3-phosphate acyltransferase
MNTTVLLVYAIAYLFGSIPFALIIGKVFYNTDIRTSGSGNLGGTNAGRVLGKAAGVSVATLDTLKAFFVILVAHQFLPDEPGYVAFAGVFAAIGHCYPIFAQFRGGKAVSTAFGYLLGVSLFLVNPQLVWVLFFLPIAIALTTLKFTKYVSFSAMVSVTITVVLSFFVQSNLTVSLALVMIDILLIYRHRSNIERLRNGTERKVTWI